MPRKPVEAPKGFQIIQLETRNPDVINFVRGRDVHVNGTHSSLYRGDFNAIASLVRDAGRNIKVEDGTITVALNPQKVDGGRVQKFSEMTRREYGANEVSLIDIFRIKGSNQNFQRYSQRGHLPFQHEAPSLTFTLRDSIPG